MSMRSSGTLVVMAVLLMATLFLFGCSQGGTEATSQEPLKLRFSTGLHTGHYFCNELVPFFIEEVEKRTDGRVKVEFYPAGELLSFTEGIDAVVSGQLDIGLTSIGHWGGYGPIFTFSDYFLLINDNDHWHQSLETIGPIMEKIFNKQNVQPLFYPAYGGNGIASKKPINELADIKGLKIRAPVPGALKSIETLGVAPAQVSIDEVYDALDKGSLDGIVTSWNLINNQGFHETTDYYIGPVWYTAWVTFINNNKWNSLPEDIQKTILDVSKETQERSLEMSKRFDEEDLEKLENRGKLKFLTTEEQQTWKKLLKPAYESWLKECSKAGYEEEAQKIWEALK